MTQVNYISLLAKAAHFAAYAHRGQPRKEMDVAFINHPIEVAKMVAETGFGAHVVACAYLHDVVEDTEVSLDSVRHEFGSQIADIVDRLTKWWPDDASQEVKAISKPQYYRRIKESPDALAIKLCDRICNLNDMIIMVEQGKKVKWARSYARKTENEFPELLQEAQNLSEVMSHLADVLVKTLDKLNAAVETGMARLTQIDPV